MSEILLPAMPGMSFTRRRFVQGLAAAGGLLSLGLPVLGGATSRATRSGPAVLRGNRFELSYRPTRVNFTGRERYATAVNGSVPAPVLR